jgi:hypothetical protein
MLEVLQIRESGRLVDDRVGLGLEHGLAHRARVEQIERDRLRPERLHAFAVSGRPERADHLVPSVDQLRDEPGADRAARSCYEDSHRCLLVTSAGFQGSTCMTRRDEGM